MALSPHGMGTRRRVNAQSIADSTLFSDHDDPVTFCIGGLC